MFLSASSSSPELFEFLALRDRYEQLPDGDPRADDMRNQLHALVEKVSRREIEVRRQAAAAEKVRIMDGIAAKYDEKIARARSEFDARYAAGDNGHKDRSLRALIKKVRLLETQRDTQVREAGEWFDQNVRV